MSKEINRLVIDTNLWISLALGSRKVAEKLIPIISSDYIRVFTSIELLDEITETLQKPRLQIYLTQERVKTIFDLLLESTIIITITSDLKICRDKKDDFLLNLAVDAKANYLLSGDKDLLDLGKVDTVEIVTIAEFYEKYF